MIAFTDRAADLLRAAASAAGRFDKNAHIRVRRDGDGVAFELTDGPHPGDSVFEAEGFSVLVEDGLDGTVDAGEHGVLSLIPFGG